MSNILERKFTYQELIDIIYEGGLYNDDTPIFETVDEKLTYYDLGKSYIRKDFVIIDISTGLNYKANLMIIDDMEYIKEELINTTWKEVTPTQKTITVYE